MEFRKHPGSYAEGAYAVVFFVEDRAIKVFKRRPEASDEHVRAVFESEIEAYKHALCTDDLRELVRHFIGATTCCAITDVDATDISKQFYLDCAYEMAWVQGDFKKFGTLSSEITEDLGRRFHAAGILHLIDSSIVVDVEGRPRHVVDFAMREHELIDPSP
jgi:hypothetical protein